MARFIVKFPGSVRVKVDGTARDDTNQIITVEPGTRVVSLLDEATEPNERIITVAADAGPNAIMRVGFRRATAPLKRYSPLYCRYNGFLLALGAR